jgi:alcohol dehydrogenase (cytochrome c)
MRLLPLILLLAAPLAEAQVPFERIRHAEAEPGNWLTYSGNYQGHRHSPLTQLTPENVADLKPAWIYQARDPGKIETSPIVLDGILYVTEKPYVVTALDGRTGRPLWSYRRAAVNDVPTCCGQVNRGLAILGDTLYFGTLDAHLVALDVSTGKLRWDVTVADYKVGHSLTAAPLAVKDKIIVGISGGEFGIRGFIDAYDAKTGKLVWRRWTIPGPGEPGHESWGPGDSWKNGGAPAWVTGSYDADLNLLYWGIGNPGPDYDGDDRPGDNLYSDSILALDADTGDLRWYFQYTPHDLHDWDSNQVPVLVDAAVNGTPRKLVVHGNRNGFYYVLDRTTGQFVTGTPYIRQTWASGLDAKGRPILLPDKEPSAAGVLVYPGLAGAVNWPSPSYSPRTQLFYVQAQEDYAQIFYKLKNDFKPGAQFEGGSTRDQPGVEPYGVVKALEATTGKVRWEFSLHAPCSGGVLSTGGGLVFSGNREGAFFALDAQTGKALWHFQTGGGIWANPISYLVDGKQYVAIAAGQGIFVFAR